MVKPKTTTWVVARIVVIATQMEGSLMEIRNYANLIASRINEEFSWPVVYRDYKLAVTVSIGIHLFGFDNTDELTILQQADEAMYQAKSSGDNAPIFYEFANLVEEPLAKTA